MKRYVEERKLGTGGSGTVYLGWRTGPEGFRRRVALKRAHRSLVADPKARRALLREALLASRIHHAHVVPVIDIEVDEDEIVLVLEYVDGASLAEILDASFAGRTDKLAPRVAVRILLDACAGLTELHEFRGDAGEGPLVHRDVSPHNVLVGRDGLARITDFGLAHVAETSSTTAGSGFVGKLGYLAPEVLDGDGHSAAADLYALGVVAWEAFARCRLVPPHANDAEARRAVREGPPRLSRVAPWPGNILEAVVHSALARSPDARPPSVRAFAEALERTARAGNVLGTHAEVGAWIESLRSADAPRTESAGDEAAFAGTASMIPSVADDAPTMEVSGWNTAPVAPPRTTEDSVTATRPAVPASAVIAPLLATAAAPELGPSPAHPNEALSGAHASRRRVAIAVAAALALVSAIGFAVRAARRPAGDGAGANGAATATATAASLAAEVDARDARARSAAEVEAEDAAPPLDLDSVGPPSSEPPKPASRSRVGAPSSDRAPASKPAPMPASTVAVATASPSLPPVPDNPYRKKP